MMGVESGILRYSPPVYLGINELTNIWWDFQRDIPSLSSKHRNVALAVGPVAAMRRSNPVRMTRQTSLCHHPTPLAIQP
jgi:hypothetical protein